MPRPPDAADRPGAGPGASRRATAGARWPPAIAVEWVAEVWVDPDWYAAQESDDPCPSPGLPVVVPLRRAERARRPALDQPQHPPATSTAPATPG